MMQTLLSEHWHAVCGLRPRLRDGVEVLHRRLRGNAWVLLLDTVTQRFHRMTPHLWHVIELFDGQRTLDEIWVAACAASSDRTAAPTISQHDLVQLTASLYANDLLQTQVSPDAGEMFERFDRQSRQRLKQSWLNPLSVRIPLLHPDAWFERRIGLARLLVSWPALVAWLILVVPASLLVWQHWTLLTENLSDRVLSASNVVLLWFTYPAVKAIHEFAHGMAVKAFGGTVREIGLMFVAFTPVPYVDATSSYRFPSKWSRALVAAAGIMAEMLLGATALYVWLTAESGLVTAIAFNVVLIAGVSTVLINGNPLMRYDGYFVLCDLLEVPNLAHRSNQYLTYLADRYAFGARDATPPLQARGERVLLSVFGVVSPIYRLVVTFGLIWFVASEYLFVGAVMALMAAWSALLVPLWNGWKHLTQGASLVRRRLPAMRRSLLLALFLIGFIALVPLPFNVVHHAVVWVPDEAIVRAESGGHVVGESVGAGRYVLANGTLLQLENLQLTSDVGIAAAALAQTRAQLRRAEADNPVRAALVRTELVARTVKLYDAQKRFDQLTVHSAVAGRWAPKASTELTGRYVKRGDVLGYIVSGPSAIVRVAISQEDMELIHSRSQAVSVRLGHALGNVVPARVSRQVPGGETDLVSAALGTSGGGEIAVDPAQQGGVRALKRVFDLEVLLSQASRVAVFGDRAYVRFDLGTAPLGWQWFLRLRQLFLSRLNV